MLDKKRKEGKSSTVELNDVGSDTFEICFMWIYRNVLYIDWERPDRDENDMNKRSIVTPTPLQLVKTWIHADRFLMPTCANDAITALHTLCGDASDLFKSDFIKHVYAKDRTAKRCHLRKFFAGAWLLQCVLDVPVQDDDHVD